jgi:hypothetical protein
MGLASWSIIVLHAFAISAFDLDDAAGDDQENARIKVATTVLTRSFGRRFIVIRNGTNRCNESLARGRRSKHPEQVLGCHSLFSVGVSNS